MEYTFDMMLTSLKRGGDVTPPASPTKWELAASAMPGYTDREHNAELCGMVPHENDVLCVIVSVEIPDNLGVMFNDMTRVLYRPGHRTTDGKGDRCEIIAPTFVWPVVAGQSTDALFQSVVERMNAMSTVKLSYPDRDERKVIPIPVTNWWATFAKFPVDDSWRYDARHVRT